MKVLPVVVALGMLVGGARGDGPRVVPGPQPDGSMLLHNQWPIRPAGAQIPLGDFPVKIAIDPSGGYAAILHSGYGAHQIWVVDLAKNATVSVTTLHDSFGGLAFSPDGRFLYCPGGGDPVVRVFAFADGRLTPTPDIPLPVTGAHAVAAPVLATPDGSAVFVGVIFQSRIIKVDLSRRHALWAARLDDEAHEQGQSTRVSAIADIAPNDSPFTNSLVDQSDPFGLAFDARRHRVYASLWGRSQVAVLDANTGRELARWPVGLHPNELVLSRDYSRLFVSNGGRNSITVLDPSTGRATESLNSAFAASDLPGSTPDSLSLSPDGSTLFAANASNNNLAVFDVSAPGAGRPLGFIPTGWYPTAVRLAPRSGRLLYLSARGLSALPNGAAHPYLAPQAPKPRDVDVQSAPATRQKTFPYIGTLYEGSLGLLNWPDAGPARDQALKSWTSMAAECRPAPTPPAADPHNPIPAGYGGPTPLRHVIYIIKENRTYDEVFGDLAGANGDPSLCLFPEATTPNLHKLARQFVILDNLYANAEISASGHEWSMGGYSSEFVERMWPVNYGHKKSKVPYPGEGGYAAALPASGYLWDAALRAGVSFRDYGEFAHGDGTAKSPARSNLPTLEPCVDPLYHPWNLTYSDVRRADHFVAELHRFEQEGEMPRLQIVRLGNDHTEAAKFGALCPRALVAQNDFAVGQLVDAVSHSRFWASTAIFIIEDDAQNGPDHVDAHRTEALVISPYVRHGAVDSTAYTTCSMLASIERILGLKPMSQFDAAAAPMFASFQAAADLAPYQAEDPRVSLVEKNTAHSQAAAMSAHFDFSHEDAIDDQAFNHVIWAAMKGETSAMPAPVHAAFVRALPRPKDDGDDDDQ